MTETEGRDTAPTEQTVAGWRRAEATLFASVMLSPESYQAAVLGVRRAADLLRAGGDSWSSLVDADVLAARLRTDAAAGELDPLVVSAAALAVRHREVALAEAARSRLRLLESGRAAGNRWVVLEERGPVDGDLLRPYRRLEADVTVAAAAVDLATGQLREPDGADVEPSTHPDAATREERVRSLRGNP